MDDNKDSIVKIKNEPMDPDDYPEVIQELVVDGYEVNVDEMNQLEVEPSDLGILGNIMKAYDELSAEGNNPGQVDFMLGDDQYSYIVTVKRVDKPLIVDRNKIDSTLVNNVKINKMETGNKRSCEEASLTLSRKGIIPITKAEILTDYENIIIETVDFDDDQTMGEFENDSLADGEYNGEMTFDDEDDFVSEDDEELMNQLDNDELSYDNIHHDEQSSNETTDTDVNDPSNLTETSNELKTVSKNNPDERSIHKCKQCKFMTARADRLTHHINAKHEGKSTRNDLVKEEPPDEDSIDGQEIVISDENIYESKHDDDENTDSLSGEKTVRPKRVRKRDKALKEFLELLNNGTKIIQPFCNKSKKKETKEDNNSKNEFNEVHKCSFCSFNCNDRTELYRHIGLIHAHNPNEHYKKGKLRTDCVFCPYKGLNRKSLLLHLRTKHRNGKGYVCNQCDYKTHHKSNFDRHVEVVHEKKRDLKCSECGFLTTRNYLLEKHIMYKHQGIKPYICPEPGCGFGSTSSSNRKAHIMEVHKGMKPHVCVIESCDFSTSRKFILKSHLYKDHGIGEPPGATKVNKDGEESKPPYSCPHCPHKTLQKGNLQKHIRVRHLGQFKRYKCADCNYSASEKCFVKTHISEVHLGQYPFSCHLCKFKCSARQRFERHFSAVHMGHRPYHCEFCDYKASQPVHLQRHIEVIHRGEKPHFCVYCKFNTAHRSNLRAHLKSIHRVSQDHIKEVLLSCVDLRMQKKRGVNDEISEESNSTDELQPIIEQEYEIQEEIVPVPEVAKTIIELEAKVMTEQSHPQAAVITVPAVVTEPSIPNHHVDNVDDLEALEASLVLEKIGQHQSLAIADTEGVSLADVTEVEDITIEHQVTKTTPNTILPKVERRQFSASNVRRVYVSKQQTKKEVITEDLPKEIHIINSNMKCI